jgi:hypothetical protein
MWKSLALCLMAAGLLFSTAETRAEDAAARALWDALTDNDIDPATVPKGYKFERVEPIGRGDMEDRQKVERMAAARFKRDGLIGNNSLEGFYYIIFANPQDAAKYTLTEQDHLDGLKPWLGNEDDEKQFNPRAWRGSLAVGAMRCTAADVLIGCLSLAPRSNVAIYLALQEPKLRAAKTDDERKRLVTARVQTEVGGLLKTAEAHLAKARKSVKQ